MAYSQLKLYDNAIAPLKAIASNPGYPFPFYNLAPYILCTKQNKKSAKSLSESPGNERR